MIFEPMVSSQLSTAVNLLALSFGESMRTAAEADLAASLSDYRFRPLSFVGIEDGQVVAFIQTVTSYFHAHTYSLLWLAVSPSFRRRGLGREMMQGAERHVASSIFRGAPGTLMLVAEHEASYYEALGFQKGQRTHDGFEIMVKYVNC